MVEKYKLHREAAEIFRSQHQITLNIHQQTVRKILNKFKTSVSKKFSNKRKKLLPIMI